MRSLTLPVFLLLLLAACAAAPGNSGQLDRMSKAQTEGRDAANAAEVAEGDCLSQPTDAACLRIQAIRGRACLALARSEAAPGAACPPPTPSARRHLDCAVEAYSKAGGAASTGSADAQNLTENAARAQYCAAGFKPPADGLGLLRQARSGLSGLPSTAERDLLGASVALAMAQRAGLAGDERCAAAREASRLAARALDGSPPPPLADASRATRNAARAEAAGLANCGGV